MLVSEKKRDMSSPRVESGLEHSLQSSVTDSLHWDVAFGWEMLTDF